MKKAIIKIVFAIIILSLFSSCKSLCESMRKRKEAKLPQEEKNSLFFSRLSSFVANEDVQGFSTFLASIANKDVEGVINRRNNSGRTLLHMAVLLENSELTRLILTHNPNRDIRDNFNKTAQDYAIASKNKTVIALFGIIQEKKDEIVTEPKNDFKIEDKKQSKEDKKQTKKETVEEGGYLSSMPIKVDTVAYSYDVMLGNTSAQLLKAVKKQSLGEVEKLLNSGSDVNELDSLGNNGLFYALLNNNIPILKLLVRNHINCNNANNAGRYPLLCAVDKLDVNAITTLLQGGASIYVRDNEGFTAVMIATYRKALSILEMLDRYNASFDVKDARGNTPLHIAIQNEDVPTLRFLLKHDLDITEPNNKGITPLQMMKTSKNAQIRYMAKDFNED